MGRLDNLHKACSSGFRVKNIWRKYKNKVTKNTSFNNRQTLHRKLGTGQRQFSDYIFKLHHFNNLWHKELTRNCYQSARMCENEMRGELISSRSSVAFHELSATSSTCTKWTLNKWARWYSTSRSRLLRHEMGGTSYSKKKMLNEFWRWTA